MKFTWIYHSYSEPELTDYVIIYDGPFSEDLLSYLRENDPYYDMISIPQEVGWYCGSHIPEIEWAEIDSSTSNEVFVSFTSNDYDDKRKGFKLKYSQYGKLHHLTIRLPTVMLNEYGPLT